MRRRGHRGGDRQPAARQPGGRQPRGGIRLTRRGICLAIAGVVLVLAAYWMRQAVLLGPAAMLLAAIAAGVVSSWRRRGLAASWQVPAIVTEHTPTRLEWVLDRSLVGSPARVRTEWGGIGSWTTIVEGATRARPAVATIDVPALPRGAWSVGQLEVRVIDALGLTTRIAIVDGEHELLVAPRVTHLSPSTLRGRGADREAGGGHGGGDHLDQLVRDYRPGDPMRRIHWRQTASRDRLMVRQEMPPAPPEARVVLDTMATGYDDVVDGRSAQFEQAVRVFASLVAAYVAAGYEVAIEETGTAQLTDMHRLQDRQTLLAACARLELEDAPATTAERRASAALVMGAGSDEARQRLCALPVGSSLWSVAATPPEAHRGVRVMHWPDGAVHERRSRFEP